MKKKYMTKGTRSGILRLIHGTPCLSIYASRSIDFEFDLVTYIVVVAAVLCERPQVVVRTIPLCQYVCTVQCDHP